MSDEEMNANLYDRLLYKEITNVSEKTPAAKL